MPLYTPENTALIGRRCKVLLDGVEVSKVVEADTDAGYIVRGVTDDAGNFVRAGDEFATERLTGSVVVVFEEEEA